MAWRSLKVPPSSLRCGVTLRCGQVFHWRPLPDSTSEWYGVIQDQVIKIKETPDDTLWQVLGDQGKESAEENIRDLLAGYFRLPRSKFATETAHSAADSQLPPLEVLYQDWADADPDLFGKVGPNLPGIRIIRQDPFECLISFICSSNNHINRITTMLDRLRASFGRKLLELDGFSFHEFPTPDQLSQASEQELRDLGFGYRAKYVVKTVQQLQDLGGSSYLTSLVSPEKTSEQRSLALQQFSGVGRKVADCVALFSLECLDIVPVDTHVLQIAQRHYGFKPGKSSMTPTQYQSITELFRERFRYAGWAHSVLFAAQLPQFTPHAKVAGKRKTSIPPPGAQQPHEIPEDPTPQNAESQDTKRLRRSPRLQQPLEE